MIANLTSFSHLETVLSQTVPGFALMDTDFRFQSVDPRMARFTGRAEAEHLGRYAAEILGEPHWSNLLCPAFRRALAGEDVRDLALEEVFPISGKGRRLYGSCFGVQIDSSRKGVVLLVRDLTDCLEIERDRQILERITDAFVSWDASWRYTYVNTEAERLLRVRREDILGKSVWEAFPEMVDSPFYAASHRVHETQQAENLEGTMSGLDTWLRIRIFPETPGGLSVYFQDITEDYEAAIRRREMARFQQDFMQDILHSVTGGKLTLCCDAAELPPPLPESLPQDRVSLTPIQGVRELRKAAETAAQALNFTREAWFDLEVSIGEAAMNTVVHAGGGDGIVSRDTRRGIIQVRIADQGKGIALEHLPHALLQQGFTTAGTMGQGFKMILQMADHVWLLTNDEGTVVILEKKRL